MTSRSVMSLSSLRPMCGFVFLLVIQSALTQGEVCNEDGAVRLVGGTVYQGRLEVCAVGVWGTVCNNEFDINDARVVCRQLGIQENASTGVIWNIFFGEGSTFQPIHLDELQCLGSEDTLLNCTHSGIGDHDCTHSEDVGIICQRSLDCTDGDVRLVDGDGDSFNVTEGRVEYCVGGLWGTVCNFLWGNADAAVVCRQLRLNALDPRAKSTEDVPNVKNLLTPIVLDGLTCRGTEDRLGDCGHLSFVEECSHSNDVGAFCTNIRECNDNDVRLNQVEDNQKENEGRVEFCSSRQWGLVCYNGWDNNDATVVCRQLGYNVDDGSALAIESSLGYDPPRLWLNGVNCVGTESSISLCPVDNRGCLYPGAGVICPLVIGFGQAVSTVQEKNDSTVNIIIYSNNTSEEVTIIFTTHSGNASEGDDYVGVFQMPIYFPEGSIPGSISIIVNIVNDDLVEGLEIFYGKLVVSSPTLNYTEVITIEILDDEGEGACSNMVEGRNCSENSLCTVSRDGRELSCYCPEGYIGSGFICQDIDECASGLDTCDQHAHCNNTNGSFECNCKDGYVGDDTLCLDTETALANLVSGPCNPGNDTCICISGFHCTCLLGYETMITEDGTVACIDIDECSSNPCGDHGICVNEIGTYKCYCPLGYTFNSTLQSCVDLDECFYGTFMCDSNAYCTNTDGSYTCTCTDDYYGDGETCLSKKILEACKISPEGKDCGCLQGYFLNSSCWCCEDIDECKRPMVCNKNANCTNTEGSYTCKCNDGYQGNGLICNDIDECNVELHMCDVNAYCNNTDGSYDCTCKSNFFGNGTICEAEVRPEIAAAPESPVRPNIKLSYNIGQEFCLEDITSFPHGISIHCPLGNIPIPSPTYTITATKVSSHESEEVLTRTTEDTLFLATLNSLFEYNTSKVTVICDVCNSIGCDNSTTIIRSCKSTECQDGVTNNCSQTCTRDDLKEHQCSCFVGYELIDGLCTDINECNSAYNCSEHEKCQNTPGSYHCVCDQGFERVEAICQDINECVTNNMIRCQNHETCINAPGYYTCQCKDGFQRKEYESDCVDIDECSNSSLNTCLENNHEVCSNLDGGFECQCEKGFRSDINSNGTCQDLNECINADEPCSQNCTNTEGSYFCFCQSGYFLNTTDNTSCQDIDECDTRDDKCDSNAFCTNTIGSYSCSCKPLYTGNGYNCAVLDSVVIGSSLGSLSFILVIAIVLGLIFFCRYIKCSSWKGVTSGTPTSGIDNTTDQRDKGISVQSSYKLILSPHLIVPSSAIRLVEPIGQGEFGIVYKGYVGRNVTKPVAVKTLKGFYDRLSVRELLKESSKMNKFDHPNVLSLSGVCLDGGPAPFIIMPLMANGSLLSYLKKNRSSLVLSSQIDVDMEEVKSIRKQLLDICIQIARGMEYLAIEKIVHRDLAARNCMIDINFVIKVADFGLTVSVGKKDYFRQDKTDLVKLPLKWLAPESIEDQMFTEKSDVWAYGITCWEVFTGGRVPYASMDIAKLQSSLTEGYRLEKPNNAACNDEMYMAMIQCWEYESEKRPSFSALVDRLSQYLESLSGYTGIGSSKSNFDKENNEYAVTTEVAQSLTTTSPQEKDSVLNSMEITCIETSF